ncbi:MAG TPA: hypothetical protein VFE92_12615 [Dermatophilaceae bacterium]|nr:hypothetical protein [Dermatophilaceae bacterium]
MSTSKRLRAPLIVTFGVIMAAMTFAGPANADECLGYPVCTESATVLGASASAGTVASAPTVAGTTASAPIQVAGVSASAPAASSGLAFTGTNAIGIGALGGLLLVGGGAMVFAGRRRKVNA